MILKKDIQTSLLPDNGTWLSHVVAPGYLSPYSLSPGQGEGSRKGCQSISDFKRNERRQLYFSTFVPKSIVKITELENSVTICSTRQVKALSHRRLSIFWRPLREPSPCRGQVTRGGDRIGNQ